MGICRITPGCNPSQGLICNITEHYPFKCTCPPFYYWDSGANLCIEQKIVSIGCSSNEECRSNTGLYCDIICKCLDNYFWSNDKCSEQIIFSSNSEIIKNYFFYNNLKIKLCLKNKKKIYFKKVKE